MAKKKVTWGQIGLSFGIACVLGIFGLAATTPITDKDLLLVCSLLTLLGVISFVFGYKLLNTGLDQEQTEVNNNTKEVVKQAIRELQTENNGSVLETNVKPQSIDKALTIIDFMNLFQKISESISEWQKEQADSEK